MLFFAMNLDFADGYYKISVVQGSMDRRGMFTLGKQGFGSASIVLYNKKQKEGAT